MERENGRERIALQKPAKFTLKDGARGWGKCTLRNLSQNLKGVGIRFHTLRDIKVNSIVIIDLSTAAGGESLSIIGIVRWINKVEDGLMGGIELIGNSNKLKKILEEVSFT